jgi:hypothetical protein
LICALQVTAQTTLAEICAALPKCVDLHLDLRGNSIAPAASEPQHDTSSFSRPAPAHQAPVHSGVVQLVDLQERVEMPVPLLDKASTVLTLGQWRRHHGRRNHPRWTLAGAGHMLHNGSLQLPEGGQLWLEGRGVRLESLSISGVCLCMICWLHGYGLQVVHLHSTDVSRSAADKLTCCA